MSFLSLHKTIRGINATQMSAQRIVVFHGSSTEEKTHDVNAIMHQKNFHCKPVEHVVVLQKASS